MVQVPPGAAGLRLDRFLATVPELGTRSRAKSLIDGGLVRVGRHRGDVSDGGLVGSEGEFQPIIGQPGRRAWHAAGHDCLRPVCCF